MSVSKQLTFGIPFHFVNNYYIFDQKIISAIKNGHQDAHKVNTQCEMKTPHNNLLNISNIVSFYLKSLKFVSIMKNLNSFTFCSYMNVYNIHQFTHTLWHSFSQIFLKYFFLCFVLFFFYLFRIHRRCKGKVFNFYNYFNLFTCFVSFEYHIILCDLFCL